MDGTDCNICFHHYDDQTRLPRTLSCGHSFCTNCITESIKQQKMVCPCCRQEQNIASAEHIAITFALLDLSLKESVSSNGVHHAVEPEVHAGICPKHHSFGLFWCSDCMVWICRDCCIVDHPFKTCSVVTVDQALKNLKEEEEVLFDTNQEACLQHLELLKEYQQKLIKRAEEHETQFELFQALNESHSKTIDKLRKEKERVEESLKEADVIIKKMKAAKDHLQKVNTLASIECAQRELHIRSKILSEWMTRSKEDILELSSEQISSELGHEIKLMLIATGYSIGNPLEEAGLLFSHARQMLTSRINVANLTSLASTHQLWTINQDSSSLAPLVLRNGQLHLYSLREGEEPQGAFILPYKSVRSLAPQPTQVFLEFTFSSGIKESVYITFGSNENNYTSLIRRCTGELYLSFRTTSVYGQADKRNLYLFPLFLGVHRKIKDFTKVSGTISQINPGNGLVTLGICNGLPCFVTWYQSHTHSYQWSDVPIGKVTKGLDIIEKMAVDPKVSEIILSDSGLVVS